MASYRNENRPDSGDLLSWIITIVLLVSPVWPIGLILLLRKLTGGSRRRASRHPYDIQREGGPVPGTQGMPGAQRQTPPVGRQHVGRSPRQGRPVNLDRGKGLTVWGIVLTVIFGIALTGFPAVAMSGGFLSALAVMSPVIGFFGGGLAMIWAGTQRTKKAKRFRKYLALIGRRESISITTLAQAMPVSVHKACDDLQDMLDFQAASDFHGDVLAVRIVNQVFERDNKGVGLRITGQTVIRIIDCDEAKHCRASDDCVPKEQISGRIGKPIERKDGQ